MPLSQFYSSMPIIQKLFPKISHFPFIFFLASHWSLIGNTVPLLRLPSLSLILTWLILLPGLSVQVFKWFVEYFISSIISACIFIKKNQTLFSWLGHTSLCLLWVVGHNYNHVFCALCKFLHIIFTRGHYHRMCILLKGCVALVFCIVFISELGFSHLGLVYCGVFLLFFKSPFSF